LSHRKSWRRIAQGIGFLIGLGLLWWCVSVALSEQNREQLSRLLDASAWQVSLLLACSVGTLVLNGLIFWVVLLPVKRTGVVYMSSVNGAATLLSYAPFKIALAFRVLVHQRIDRVPLLTIGAWFAVIGVLTATVLGPAIGASFIFDGGTALWWEAWIGGSALLTGLCIGVASIFAGDRGWARLIGLMGSIGLGFVVRWLGTEHGRKIHAGVDMLAHTRASSAAGAFRVMDILVQAVRVLVAAEILGVEMGWGAAMVIASTYYLIGMLSPIGMLGPRESGIAGIAALAGLSGEGGAESILLVGMLISATEAFVNLAGGGLGAVYLRVDRWLLKSGIGNQTQDEDSP
jgi:hypothetical protein